MGKEIVILGGGPAGMACAFELSREKIKSTLIERDKAVGGFAKTLVFNEDGLLFRTDIGPHRFFSKNQYLYDLIADLLGEDWRQVKRQTRQLIEGKFYDYPINAMQAFKNIGPLRSVGMAASYAKGALSYRIFNKEIKSFEDYIIANFGKKLGEFSMLNYTEKIWGIPCTEIHPDWAKQRIKGLSLVSALKNALLKKKEDGPKTLVDSFYYPKYGTGSIYGAMASRVLKAGSTIKTESYPEKITWSKNRITELKINENGKIKTVNPDILISSIPITDFLNLLSPEPPKEVIDATKQLKWRDQIYLFMTIDKERVTTDNWIYFPTKDVPFGRISEMKNFSPEMSPKDKTSIFVEFFVTENEGVWNLSEKELFDLTIKYLEEYGLVKREEVRKYHVLKKKKVYPVYDLHYQEHLKVIKDFLSTIDNFYPIGRPGRFQYNNQDHSLEMGIVTAKAISKGEKVDLDSIGSEKEYFEKGYIKS